MLNFSDFQTTKYFSLSWRTRQTLYLKSGRLHCTTNNAFGTISCKNCTDIALNKYFLKKLHRPHFRLFLGRKGIEINNIKHFIEVELSKVCFNFCEPKIRTYLNLL